MLRRNLARRALLGALPAVLIAPLASRWSGNLPESAGGTLDEDVSPVLMRAICSHCVAYAKCMRLAREPISASPQAICDAIHAERMLLLALISFPARNAAERDDMATYLSAFLKPESEPAEHRCQQLKPSSGVTVLDPSEPSCLNEVVLAELTRAQAPRTACQLGSLKPLLPTRVC